MKFKLVRIADGVGFTLQQSLVAGRLSECDIPLTKGLPSRRHAQVTQADEGVWVEDLGSANGTFVNGERIQGKTLLNSGDVIRFDVEEFRFEAEGAVNERDAATLFRPPSPNAQPAAQAPVKIEASGVFKRPGAWADPDSTEGSQKTRFMDPAVLQSMIGSEQSGAAPVAGSADAPCIVVLSGEQKGKRIGLRAVPGAATEWNIGSGVECEICLPTEGVSALHARLIQDAGRWKIVDQMSANGTYVNGKRATMAYLGGADRIAVGPVECMLELPAGSSPPRSEAATSRGRPATSMRTWIIVAIVLALGATAALWLM